MQFIQLQTQQLNNIPTPGSGKLNFFIGEDGLVKLKNENGIIVTVGTGGAGVNQVTYEEFYGSITGGTLTPGSFYMISDYETCYDQPDFDVSGNVITVGNYKTSGNIQPIIVFATDIDQISIDAFQPDYPMDKIKYDWTYNLTEVTQSPAKGRIIERIDEFNNRTDYDHRNILFKRYDLFYPNFQDQLIGTLDMVDGVVTGYGTQFTSLNTGAVIYIGDSNLEYIITTITDDINMVVSGLTYNNTYNSFYYSTNTIANCYKRNNVQDGSINYSEHYTFELSGDNTITNNYIGSYTDLADVFYLANNVFISNNYIDNTIGGNSYNNTFDDDCYGNIIGVGFSNNTCDDDFDNNIIGNYFENNRITANFNDNHIGNNFNNNLITNSDFYRNVIGNEFNYNFITVNDFQNNIIGNQFNNNAIKAQLIKNKIGNGFKQNQIFVEFTGNIVGNGFNGNSIGGGEFYDNNIGQYFENNTIVAFFNENSIGDSFRFNNITYTGYTINFQENKILNGFENNSVYVNFERNSIGFEFKGNQITYDPGNNGGFTNNILGNMTLANFFGGQFSSNKVGNFFLFNNFTGTAEKNIIADGFESNDISEQFSTNKIGYNFYDNAIGEYFGYGYGSARGNTIGNFFQNNTTRNHFYDNVICDNFTNNVTPTNFQYNDIKIQINGVDFRVKNRTILTVSINTPNSSQDGNYGTLSGIASGDGEGATFQVEVVGGIVTGVTIQSPGYDYTIGETITIPSNNFNGDGTDLVITVTNISPNAMVTGYYNCTIINQPNETLLLTTMTQDGPYYMTDITEVFD
jgi:hypothetical protein